MDLHQRLDRLVSAQVPIPGTVSDRLATNRVQEPPCDRRACMTGGPGCDDEIQPSQLPLMIVPSCLYVNFLDYFKHHMLCGKYCTYTLPCVFYALQCHPPLIWKSPQGDTPHGESNISIYYYFQDTATITPDGDIPNSLKIGHCQKECLHQI